MLRTLPFICLGITLLCYQPGAAQNLVPNPSFDIQDTCPTPDDLFLAPPWDTPTSATPDLFNGTCSTQNHPGHTGPGNAGVYAFGPFPNYREYAQAPLLSPLVAGQNYCVSIWVKRANFRLAADRFGILFTTTAVSQGNSFVMAQTPQVENAPGNTLGGTSWQQITGSFTASGGEQYITIGNFSDDPATTTTVANPGNTSEVAYYYFDDVSVTTCAVGIPELTSAGFNIYPQPAGEQLTVQIPDDIAVSRAQLFDQSGRLLLDQAITSITDGRLSLNVRDLHSGFCTLVLSTEKGRMAQKVMLGYN